MVLNYRDAAHDLHNLSDSTLSDCATARSDSRGPNILLECADPIVIVSESD